MSIDTTDARNAANYASDRAYNLRQEPESSVSDLDLAASIISLASSVIHLANECEELRRETSELRDDVASAIINGGSMA